MNLRRQLLLVSLLLLCLPWAGCQFIREMEGALRHGQEQSLQATAQAVAAVMGQQEQLLYPYPERRTAQDEEGTSLYAAVARQPLILDGYADGWDDVKRFTLTSSTTASPLSASYRAVTRMGFLYLLLEVSDSRVTYHRPGFSQQPNGDRLVLRTWQQGKRQEYVIATAAPGSVRAAYTGRRNRGADPNRIRGYWQDAIGGYTLELEIPLEYTGGRLGFYLVNSGTGAEFETLGNITPATSSAPPWLIYSPQALQHTLAAFSRPGTHIEIVDQQDWLLADISPTDSIPEETPETFWLLRVLYRSILANDRLELPVSSSEQGKSQGPEIAAALAGQSANHRYRDPNYATRTRLSAAAPIRDSEGVMGAVILRQSGEEYLSLTDQAFSRLLGYSLLALGVGAFGLLAYASLLSWRIGKLSRAAAAAISSDGALRDSFPRSNANDEIGELSRRYAELLDQLREYNDYLRTLSRKLAHELRTPLAVIQSSLDNLEQADDETDPDVYLDRARGGLVRLNRILTAMSEANRLEESIRNNQTHEFDLAALLREVFGAYQAIYPGHRLAAQIPAGSALVKGVPELLVQALDKLMDNAASFATTDGMIELGLTQDGDSWLLSVSNEGPLLPSELRDHLFDPMVSLRTTDVGDVHLGLGLHVVRLITDYHDGTVTADNLADDSGVRVTIALPV